MSPKIKCLAYGAGKAEQRELVDLAQVLEIRKEFESVWVDISGEISEELKATLITTFGLHRLAVADLSHEFHRSRAEDYGTNTYVISQTAEELSPSGFSIEPYHMWLTGNLLITVQRTETDCLDRIRAKILQGDAKIQQKSIDYLLYLIVDQIVQAYFPILEKIEDDLEEIEDQLIRAPRQSEVRKIYLVKRQLLQLRKAVWPQRELVLALSRDDFSQIQDPIRPYFRDSYDHVVQVFDLIENSRELCADLISLYMSSISNKMNEIMKVLTIISTIFIPLSFIAGVYGMNFNTEKSGWNMPELNWPFGYPMVMGGMTLVGIGLLVLFWRWGWLSNGERGD